MYTKTVEVWSSGSYDSGFTNGSPLAKISSELQELHRNRKYGEVLYGCEEYEKEDKKIKEKIQ